MPGARRKPAERAIILAGVIGKLTLKQTNDLLNDAGFRDVPEGSWDMLQRTYAPEFERDPKLLGECIHKPRKMGDL